MNDHSNYRELQDALRALGARDAGITPPPEMESRVMAAFAAVPSRRARSPFLAWAVLSVATMAATAVLLYHGTPAAPAQEAPFVQVPYVAPPAPYERTEVLREIVPISELIAAGFDIHVPDAGSSLMADVLVGQDGRALAVRLLNNSIPTPERKIAP